MLAQKPWDVVVVGDFFIDEILSDFSSLPKLGEEAFARTFRREIGGGAAITACGLGRLGGNVGVLGGVGGEDGIWLIHRLTAGGGEAGPPRKEPGKPTGVARGGSPRGGCAFFC